MPAVATTTRAELLIPGDPVPWARAGKSGKRHFTLAAQRDHMEAVRRAWMSVGSPRLGTAPIELHAAFFRLRPPSHYGTGRNAGRVRPSAPAWATSKPDTSNLLKLVEDALNGHLYADDAQIVRLAAVVAWADAPGESRSAAARTELVAISLHP